MSKAYGKGIDDRNHGAAQRVLSPSRAIISGEAETGSDET